MLYYHKTPAKRLIINIIIARKSVFLDSAKYFSKDVTFAMLNENIVFFPSHFSIKPKAYCLHYKSDFTTGQ